MENTALDVPDFTEAYEIAPSALVSGGAPEGPRTELSDLWDAIVLEVEGFLENCENTWEVEWPSLAAGERLRSPTRKIHLLAPKPWVTDDRQCCAEITIHIDTKQLRPVCVNLHLPHAKYTYLAQTTGHLAIMTEAAKMVQTLFEIDTLTLLPSHGNVTEIEVEYDDDYTSAD